MVDKPGDASDVSGDDASDFIDSDAEGSENEASDDEDLPDSEDEQTYDLQLTPGQSPLSRSHAVLNLSAMISPTTQQQEGGIDNESEYTIVNLTPARQPVFPETRQPEDSSSSRWL